MTDPVIEDVKTDAAKAEATVKADETSVNKWATTHVWAIGAIAFVVGFIIGHIV